MICFKCNRDYEFTAKCKFHNFKNGRVRHYCPSCCKKCPYVKLVGGAVVCGYEEVAE